MAIPLHERYSASRHAIKGFTNSLRIELEKDGAPISVTLIKPVGIETMFMVHAKSYMDKEPALPPPVYAPKLSPMRFCIATSIPSAKYLSARRPS